MNQSMRDHASCAAGFLMRDVRSDDALAVGTRTYVPVCAVGLETYCYYYGSQKIFRTRSFQ